MEILWKKDKNKLIFIILFNLGIHNLENLGYQIVIPKTYQQDF